MTSFRSRKVKGQGQEAD